MSYLLNSFTPVELCAIHPLDRLSGASRNPEKRWRDPSLRRDDGRGIKTYTRHQTNHDLCRFSVTYNPVLYALPAHTPAHTPAKRYDAIQKSVLQSLLVFSSEIFTGFPRTSASFEKPPRVLLHDLADILVRGPLIPE